MESVRDQQTLLQDLIQLDEAIRSRIIWGKLYRRDVTGDIGALRQERQRLEDQLNAAPPQLCTCELPRFSHAGAMGG